MHCRESQKLYGTDAISPKLAQAKTTSDSESCLHLDIVYHAIITCELYAIAVHNIHRLSGALQANVRCAESEDACILSVSGEKNPLGAAALLHKYFYIPKFQLMTKNYQYQLRAMNKCRYEFMFIYP